MQERPSGRDESEDERLDRNLSELLQELRVALPGVQVLFAFLLAVPFQSGFAEEITPFEEKVYFATLLCTAISAALLISPTAYHRLTFHLQQKRQLVMLSNRLAIAGLTFLALAMTGAIVLITDVLFGPVATAVFGAAALAMFVALWGLLPLRRRLSLVRQEETEEERGSAKADAAVLDPLPPEADQFVGEAVGEEHAGRAFEEHFEVVLPDEDLAVELHGQAVVDVLGEDLVGLAQDGDVGGLVGGEDGACIRPGQGDPFAQLLLALLVARDRRVCGQGEDGRGDLLAEALAQLAGVVAGVLDRVVQEAGGDHLGGIVVDGEALGDRERVVDEGDLPVAGLTHLTGVRRGRGGACVADERRGPRRAGRGTRRAPPRPPAPPARRGGQRRRPPGVPRPRPHPPAAPSMRLRLA